MDDGRLVLENKLTNQRTPPMVEHWVMRVDEYQPSRIYSTCIRDVSFEIRIVSLKARYVSQLQPEIIVSRRTVPESQASCTISNDHEPKFLYIHYVFKFEQKSYIYFQIKRIDLESSYEKTIHR